MGSIPSWGTEIPQAAGEANLKKKAKIMASGPITSWQRDGEKMETVT